MEEKIEMKKCAGCGKEQNKELFKKIASGNGEFYYYIFCDECRTKLNLITIPEKNNDEANTK